MARSDVTARWLDRSRRLAREPKLRGSITRPSTSASELFERDSSIGGGLLAGALAYRLFVLLLPTALLFVSGLGLYAGAAARAPARQPRRRACTG